MQMQRSGHALPGTNMHAGSGKTFFSPQFALFNARDGRVHCEPTGAPMQLPKIDRLPKRAALG
jgi:hypothetical protein